MLLPFGMEDNFNGTFWAHSIKVILLTGCKVMDKSQLVENEVLYVR